MRHAKEWKVVKWTKECFFFHKSSDIVTGCVLLVIVSFLYSFSHALVFPILSIPRHLEPWKYVRMTVYVSHCTEICGLSMKMVFNFSQKTATTTITSDKKKREKNCHESTWFWRVKKWNFPKVICIYKCQTNEEIDRRQWKWQQRSKEKQKWIDHSACLAIKALRMMSKRVCKYVNWIIWSM